MSPRTVPADRARARSVGLAALVAALVLGILGMHALGAGVHAQAATPGVSGMSGMSGTSDPVLVTGGDHGSLHGSEHGPVPHHGGMLMLCALMLAGAAAALLVLLVGRRVRGRLLPAALQPWPDPVRLVRWVRDTGPPPVWEFSVVRC